MIETMYFGIIPFEYSSYELGSRKKDRFFRFTERLSRPVKFAYGAFRDPHDCILYQVMGQRNFVGDEKRSLSPGDWLAFGRPGYEHHAIYIGDGKIIDFNANPGKKNGPKHVAVRSFLETKGLFSRVRVVNPHTLPAGFRDRLIRKAKSFINKNEEYCLWSNNCEHFVNHCFVESAAKVTPSDFFTFSKCSQINKIPEKLIPVELRKTYRVLSLYP